MNVNKLLRSQKNELFAVVQKKGLKPSEFEWVIINSICTTNLKTPKLVHQPTEHYYIFDLKIEKHWTEYSPGGVDKWKVRRYPSSWDNQLKYFNTWLDLLKNEVEPDLWEFISKENIFKEISDSANNDYPFNIEEQEYISTRLHEIERCLISTQNLSEKHEEFVKARLNYLEEASKRQIRRDWMHTMIGVLFSIIVGIGMSSLAANELFKFASDSFQNILGNLTLP